MLSSNLAWPSTTYLDNPSSKPFNYLKIWVEEHETNLEMWPFTCWIRWSNPMLRFLVCPKTYPTTNRVSPKICLPEMSLCASMPTKIRMALLSTILLLLWVSPHVRKNNAPLSNNESWVFIACPLGFTACFSSLFSNFFKKHTPWGGLGARFKG